MENEWKELRFQSATQRVADRGADNQVVEDDFVRFFATKN